jgi:hypothetical protein
LVTISRHIPEGVHLADRRLRVVHDVVDGRDGAIELLAVHRSGEGGVERVKVRTLDVVALMLEVADPLGETGIAGAHELLKGRHRLDGLGALGVERSEEVRHLREDALHELGHCVVA